MHTYQYKYSGNVYLIRWFHFSSVQFTHSVMSNSLRLHEPQHARPPYPSSTPKVHPKPCPLSQWCHPTISSSVIPFSSCPQSFPASGSFQMRQLFESWGQSIGVSASASSSTYKGANKSVEALRGNICFNFDRWIQIFRSGPGIQASLLRQKKSLKVQYYNLRLNFKVSAVFQSLKT